MGVASGTAAAQAMIHARQGDGRFGPTQWVPSSEKGHWSLLPGQANDPTPWVGGVKPFLMRSSSQFRSAGPPALTSAAWAADFNEVEGTTQATGSTRTDEQTYIARWWQSTPVVSWNDVARQLIARNNLDVSDSARLLAMENLVAADAAINTWNDKYHFDFWRPWNAIVRASEDENDATVADDPNWAALLAPYPDHVSGHLGLDSSHTGVLKMFFGSAPAGGYQITSSFVNIPGGPAASCARLHQLLSSCRRDRRGAHLGRAPLRTADVQAVQLGTNVANYGAANYFEPVGNH